MLLTPVSSITTFEKTNTTQPVLSPDLTDTEELDQNAYILDRNYYDEENPQVVPLDGPYDPADAGYRSDAGKELKRSNEVYPGEIIDDTPGRGRTGYLLEGSDDEDWYAFSVCEGQTIDITMTPTSDYDLGLWDPAGVEKATSTNTGTTMESISFVADSTGRWYFRIHEGVSAVQGSYTFDITLNGQNDAGTAADAGNDFASATPLTEGTYNGYLDMNDAEDWYKFTVADGEGIHFFLNMSKIARYSDFDISLYNPLGEKVHEEDYYTDDELYIGADMAGEWRAKIDIFPGWTDIPQPTEWVYYAYGSGAYELTYIVESSGPTPPAPIPQPEITPIAKTFIINNDPESINDEYGYLASLPACNYLDGGMRYLAPIIYQGDATSTNYFDEDTGFGVVDDTTQYLVDDWNAYLDTYGKTAVQYTVPADPVEAAADIATNNWASSDLAVVAVDGSDIENQVDTVLEKTKTLKRTVEVEEIASDSDKIIDIGGIKTYPMLIGPKWGAINVSIHGITQLSGTADGAYLEQLFPKFMRIQGDWWPVPYAEQGDAIDIYYPITTPGLYGGLSDISNTSWDSMTVTKYPCDRYKVNVENPNSVLSVTITTDEPSDLMVFLIDPDGHYRQPSYPNWNGPVNPIHIWNGLAATGFDEWRTWKPEPHTEFTTEILHPDLGKWTVIVVPREAEGSASIKYTINGEIRNFQDHVNADMSAANAAVIASLEHAPLLYVNPDSVPTETANAFTALGVTKVIFVECEEIGAAVRGDLPTIQDDLTSMQQVIDYIKAYDASENYITITSLATGDGYFASAAMLAAYHGSPVLNIDDAPGNPAGMAERIDTWRLGEGDYYHGSRSPGHLPVANAPVEQNNWKILLDIILHQEFPPFGLDAKRYWNEKMYDDVYNWIAGYGLDLDGQEGFCVVAPREDIYIELHSVLMGNNSYAGQIPGSTPSYINDVVVRNVLYPALIYANPNRDVTTTQMMNFPDGGQWTLNDGSRPSAYSSRTIKQSFSSHDRIYDGHCLWEAHLQRLNEGASIMYYSGHGTGGSGISAQPLQQQYSEYPDDIWYDAWRGYSFDSMKTPRSGGFTWYNAEPPQLYDIIHYKWVDQLTENLMSDAVFYMSCSTAEGFAPLVYLDHGAVCWYGNAGSGLCPEADLQDDEFFIDALVDGEAIGPAYTHQVWLHFRDFTTKDPTSMYGSSSMQVTTVQCIYGDPALIVYSPEWSSPVPIDA
jgi:hypothetical protein